MSAERIARRCLVASFAIALGACGEDEPGGSTDTASGGDAVADTGAGDTRPSEASATDGAPDATADDTAEPGIDTADMTPCEKACVEAHPEGASMVLEWIGCQIAACEGLDPESDEGGMCVYMSWAPENPDAACKDVTQACFSGKDAGCKELVDLAAERCEPDTLPMSEDELFTAALCMVDLGFNATPAVQALAWPLYTCVFSDPPDGCGPACLGGADACRACAAEKCKPQYDACIADSSGSAIVFNAPTGDPAKCQDAFRCVNSCSGP